MVGASSRCTGQKPGSPSAAGRTTSCFLQSVADGGFGLILRLILSLSCFGCTVLHVFASAHHETYTLPACLSAVHCLPSTTSDVPAGLICLPPLPLLSLASCRQCPSASFLLPPVSWPTHPACPPFSHSPFSHVSALQIARIGRAPCHCLILQH